MTDEGFTVFNNRELKLLKAYMGHHGWYISRNSSVGRAVDL